MIWIRKIDLARWKSSALRTVRDAHHISADSLYATVIRWFILLCPGGNFVSWRGRRRSCSILCQGCVHITCFRNLYFKDLTELFQAVWSGWKPNRDRLRCLILKTSSGTRRLRRGCVDSRKSKQPRFGQTHGQDRLGCWEEAAVEKVGYRHQSL